MTMMTKNSPKLAKTRRTFECVKCNYKCCKESDFKKHLTTRKHQNDDNDDSDELHKSRQNSYKCECGKTYKFRQGLSVHKKKCNRDENNIIQTNTDIIETVNNTDDDIVNNIVNNTENNHIIELLIKENSDIKNIMLDVVRSNTELQKQLLDVCKNANIAYSNNHINSHNKTFNLQLFLNEQCKDAMNISDFVNSFELQLSDLESVGELGYVEGMAKIILDKLSSTDIYKRPMHCSDAKRETIYIKDEDRWEKENRTNPKLRNAIKTLSFKNMKLTNLWSDTYPESKNSESHLNDVYMKLVIQSTGGNGEIGASEDKIIRRIAKDIIIDKNSIV